MASIHIRSERRPSPRGGVCHGFTLVEMAVVTTLLAILATLAVPQFLLAVERAQANEAEARLQQLWTGQRLYWLKYHYYATSIDQLQQERYIDPSLTQTVEHGLTFNYSVVEADTTSFLMQAAPQDSSRWYGTLEIDESGNLSGTITTSDGTIVLGENAS